MNTLSIASAPTFAEQTASFVTSPIILTILLMVGLIGLTVALLMASSGMAATVGLLAFALYFFGHYMAGFATAFHIALFLIGLLLLGLELFLPGGIIGTIGFVTLASGLVLATGDVQQGLISLGIAFAAAVMIGYRVFKKYRVREVWHKLILRERQANEAGYVAPKNQRDLLGKTGIALTPLRPAGVVEIEGKRVDAVSYGQFIAPHTPIVVSQIEGTRVVVEEQHSEQKE